MPFERRYISSPKAWLTFLRFCENVWLTFPRIPPKVGLRESVSESGSFQLGDFQVVWGRGSTGSNGTGSVQFPRAFVGIPYLVAPSDISSGTEGVNAVGWDLSNSTAAGARILSADSKSSGIATTFSYIAIGKGVV